MTISSVDVGATERGLMARKLLQDDEKAVLKNLMGVLEIFRTYRSTMPMQYVITFLLVALDEGKMPSEYARKLGVSPSVMSRHLLDIGERSRHMTKGFELVTFRPRPENLREHEYTLTDKGRALAHQIIRQLEK